MSDEALARVSRRAFVVPPLPTEDIVTRALTYPYPRLPYNFRFRRGVAEPLSDDFNLNVIHHSYTAVVAIGSNASPVQLLRKFGASSDIPVLHARLHGVDVVYAACVTYYGSLPATLAASPGTVAHVYITLLDPAAFAHMNNTERAGYHICKMSSSFPDARVEFADAHIQQQYQRHQQQIGDMLMYVAIPGKFLINNSPVALAEIKADHRVYSQVPQPEIIATLARLVGSPYPSLHIFIRALVNDLDYRQSVSKRIKRDDKIDECFETIVDI